MHDSLDLVEDPRVRSFGIRALEILLDHLQTREPFPLLFNGDMLSVISVRNGEVRLGATSYFSFLLTNYLSSDKLWQEAVDMWLPGHVENRSTPLDSSIRANPLSVHVNLVTIVDGSYRVLISRRSEINLNSSGTYSHTAGGSLDRDDLVSFGNRSIHRAGSRELKEELGIEMPISKIVVADWFISCKVLDPIAVAVVLIPDASMLRWQRSSETISADWRRLEDVVEHASRDPLSWHYDMPDDIAVTVDALKIFA